MEKLTIEWYTEEVLRLQSELDRTKRSLNAYKAYAENVQEQFNEFSELSKAWEYEAAKERNERLKLILQTA